MSGWFLLASAIVQYQRKIELFNSIQQSTPNTPKNEHFLPPNTYAYVCVSGYKKCSFFGKFGMLCFLETRFDIRSFALLPTSFVIETLILGITIIGSVKSLFLHVH